MSSAFTLNSIEPLSMIFQDSTFENIHFDIAVTAAISISYECDVKVDSVIFFNLSCNYNNINQYISPALDLLCNAVVVKCCFDSCYGPRVGAFRLKNGRFVFNQNVLFKVGFWKNKVNGHPSFFENAESDEVKNYNISNCGNEYFYQNGGTNLNLGFITIDSNLPAYLFLASQIKNNLIIKNTIAINNDNIRNIASHQYSVGMEIVDCIFYKINFRENGCVSFQNVTFKKCSFSMDENLLNDKKGNAIISEPILDITYNFKLKNQFPAKCKIFATVHVINSRYLISCSFCLYNINEGLNYEFYHDM